MIVAMLEHATEDQIQRVTDHLMKMGFRCASHYGCAAKRVGRGGQAYRLRHA